MNYRQALAPLTALTKLHIEDDALDDGELRALSALTGLRVLKLCFYWGVDVLPELGVLANLKMLSVPDGRQDFVVPVYEAVNPMRKARGLPPVHIEPYTLSM